MAELIERKKFSTKKEMDLIIGMIVSDEFLSGVAPIFEHKFLLSSANRTIARWAIEYYERYQKAPKETIQEIFAYKQKDSRMSDVEVESIEKVLTNLSSVFESMENYNWTFFLDQSEKYLAERKLSLLTLEIEEFVSSGKIADAEHAVASHNRVKRPSSESFDVICDEEEIKNVLTQTESQVLLSLSGFLGTMIGDLCRGDFLSFLAPMKRGKTWWMMHFAKLCAIRGLKVLFISLEMPKHQMLFRFYQSLAGETKRACETNIPFFDGSQIKYRKVAKEGLSVQKVLKKSRALKKYFVGSGKLKLICRPSAQMTISDIKTEIYNLQHYEDFTPDVILLDYIDILGVDRNSPKETRHKIDHDWKIARGIAQELSCLFVTASQSNRSGFKKDLDEEGVAEDVRKLAHVTHMVALNQSKEEKQKQIMRANVIVSRSEEFSTLDEAVCLYNYGIGQAFLDSKKKEEKQKQIMRANVIVSRSEEFSTLDEAVCLYNYGIGQAFLDSKKKEEVDLVDD